MPTPDSNKNTPQAKETTHVAPIIERARSVVGDFSTQYHPDEEWSEQAADVRTKALTEKIERRQPITLMELFDGNSDVDRRQADRLFSQADKQKRDLSPAERNEVIAAQLRVTSRETLAKSLDTYFKLLDQYKQVKERGVSGESKDESDVFSHLQMVQTVAAKRINVAIQVKDHPSERPQLLKQALEYDRELVRLLMCQDADIPGNNPEGLLPAHRLMLAMLKKEYEGLIAHYKAAADEGFQKAKERADKGQKALENAFPGVTDFSKLPVENAEAVLRSVGYKSVQEFKMDVAAIRAKDGIFDRLKDEGTKNVDSLADLTAALVMFQAKRTELSSVRHHFDQGYGLDADAAPLPGKTPAETMDEMRSMLEAEQQASIGSLDRHLEKVEDGVLNVDLPEKAETLWNENGRIFMSRMAQRVAALETAWIPDVPGGDKNFMRDSAKEYLINGGLYDALGWPRDDKGRPKDWADLTPPERQQLQDKQDSAEKTIERFRQKQSMQKLKTSVDAAKKMISRKDLQAENLLDDEEIDEATLPKETVTDKNLDALIGKYGARTVTKMCFTQLEANTEMYNKDYKTLLRDFHQVVGIHLDVERYFDEFGGKQLRFSVSLLLLALLGIVGGAAIGFAGAKTSMWVLRTGGRGMVRLGKGGTRLVGNVLRKGGQAVTGTAEALRGSRTAQELTKLRYIQKERQLAQLLENSRAGRWVSKLKFVRNARVVQGAGTALKYGSAVLIPAVAVIETYLTSERVKSAERNKNLQAVYAENYSITALETAGYGAGLALSLGPQIVLAVPVYYTANYNRARAEVRAGWERTPADWAHEFDNAGLMSQLRETTLSSAVEAGGGGALKPRIMIPGKKDQEKAAEGIEKAQVGARQRIVEGYFMRNLLLPPDATDELAQKLLRWKVSYIGLVTRGTYNATFGYVYQEADLYADMMLRKENMEAKKEDMVIPFTDDDGQDGTIDFSKLSVGSAPPDQIMREVTKYRNFVRPVEELVLFNALGQMAKEQTRPADRARELAKAKETVRRLILSKLSHTIYKSDSYIESIDWPGVDVPLVNSGDTQSKNTIRTYLAAKIRKEVDGLADKALEGDASFKEFEKTLSSCEGIIQRYQNIEDNDGMQKAYNEAAEYLKDNLSSAENPDINPLLNLVTGPIAAKR